MNRELQRARNRQMIIFLLVCCGMLVLLGRLYYWQVLQSGWLTEAAQAQHIKNQIVNAPRGLIYDAQGRLLVANIVRDDVYVEPIQFVTNYEDDLPEATAEYIHKLRQALPQLSDETIREALSSGLQTSRIAHQVTPEQSQRLRDLRLPYTFLEPHTLRTYPAGSLAAQLLGFVQNGQGVYGIEGKFNLQLAGKPGSLTAETDLNGNPLTVGSSSGQEAVQGANLTLTIDSAIQYQVEQGLAEMVPRTESQSGTALVLDARTGAIVAMAGYPSFDPNQYSQFADKKGCIGQQDVYFHPALYCDYEPGSTMKAVTMAAGLDQKVVTPETTIQDPGYMTFEDGTPTIHNWDRKNHGTETMSEVLQYSSNVGAATVALRLGPERYYPYLEKFGFGNYTNLLEPAHEAPGGYRIPTSEGWTKSDLTRQAFGQSIQASPLQVAMAFQALANQGRLMQPYLVSTSDANGQVTRIQPKELRSVISTETAEMVTDMLIETSEYNNVKVPGYQVASKSGTATTQGLAMDETIASMVGFLPASNPRFVILVKLDRPKSSIYGGSAAGPLWMSIAQQLMLRYSVPPDQA